MNALGRHLALVGFMGAGKTTIGREVACALGRGFVDVDDEIEREEGSIPGLFARFGESGFREREAARVEQVLGRRTPAVVALGGGAVTTARVRELLLEHAFTVVLDVDVDTAWERVRGSDRPNAQDEAHFRARYAERLPLYDEVAQARASDADGVVLAA